MSSIEYKHERSAVECDAGDLAHRKPYDPTVIQVALLALLAILLLTTTAYFGYAAGS